MKSRGDSLNKSVFNPTKIDASRVMEIGMDVSLIGTRRTKVNAS